MNKFEVMQNVKDVQHIIKTGKLKIGSVETDIKDMLSNTKSEEYREVKDSLVTKDNNEHMCKTVLAIYSCTDAVYDSKYADKKIAILNFASSKHPGGGFLTGALAQEESICNHSNLYEAIKTHESFYEYNQAHLLNGVYTDGWIYTSNAVVFKSNFRNRQPKAVDFITVAAPNRGAALRHKVDDKEIEKALVRRIRGTVMLAIRHNVDVLVLGAFGCGVFKNDPDCVARVTKQILVDEGYGKYFDTVVFPFLSKKDKNYEAFSKVFN